MGEYESDRAEEPETGEEATLKLARKRFADFSDSIDQQLIVLVERWAHTAAPNAGRSIKKNRTTRG